MALFLTTPKLNPPFSSTQSSSHLFCLRSYVIALLIPPNLEVPSDSSSGMMSDGDGDGDGDSPGLADGHGDDTLMVDPFLDYIRDMLMDENMEDRTCMRHECTAYQAMVNGFYRDLQGNHPHEDDHSPQALVLDQGNFPVFADQGVDDYGWIDEVLVNELDPSMLSGYSANDGKNLYMWKESPLLNILPTLAEAHLMILHKIHPKPRIHQISLTSNLAMAM